MKMIRWAGLAALALGLVGPLGGAQAQAAPSTYVVSCPGTTQAGCTTYSVQKGLLICYCGTERVVLTARPETLAQLRTRLTPQVITLRGGTGTRTLYIFSGDAKLRSALTGSVQAEWVQGAEGPGLNLSFQRP